MRKVLVLGLGNFGREVVKCLFEMGNEIVGVDVKSEKVQQISDISSKAIIADAEDKDFLVSIRAKEMDAVLVCMGNNISQSIITTLFLKEIGVKYILAKVIDENHGRVLKKVGADKIIYPEKEVALKISRQLTVPSIIDFYDFSDEYIMTELLAPIEFAGKSLKELNLMAKYNLFIVAIKESVPNNFIVLPKADHLIKDSDVLVILGKISDINKMEKKISI